MKYFEVNFDGIVGPTHNYGGLSWGNLASMKHEKNVSFPKKAALEGMAKMKLLMDLGVKQAFLPPQLRPCISYLHSFGFTGTDEKIIKMAAKKAPDLLTACSSASSMWAANSATVTPSSDATDGRVHISIANLLNRFHRSIEADTTFQLFCQIFPDKKRFAIHPPLPKGDHLGDEGAANHTRFCKEHKGPGVHLFVYGKKAFEEKEKKFPARQTLEASQAIARRHGLKPNQVIFAEQNPELIDRGVFHNDIISVGDRNLFLYHPDAFVKTESVLQEIDGKLKNIANCSLNAIKIDIPIKKAIESYLFNSQIVSIENKTILIAPQESRSVWPKELTFDEIYYTNVHQSMKNGGGPACLRLRVVLTQKELETINPHFILTPSLYKDLVNWIKKHYREKLLPADLGDPKLLEEAKIALDKLRLITHLGS